MDSFLPKMIKWFVWNYTALVHLNRLLGSKLLKDKPVSIEGLFSLPDCSYILLSVGKL